MAIRFGVVGTGNIGAQHIGLLRRGEIPGALLAATASRHGEPVDGSIPHYRDHAEMFEAARLDAVLIATPTASHVQIATAALERNLHVLMEKPIAMSVAQAEGLLAKVAAPTCFAVMLNQRFHPVYSRVKSLLDNRAIGELQLDIPGHRLLLAGVEVPLTATEFRLLAVLDAEELGVGEAALPMSQGNSCNNTRMAQWLRFRIFRALTMQKTKSWNW